ncbi:MAG TPA: hypothetical protein VJ464_15985 [Blastocatellia bacterium]|nr:hypothetical protein [Blastocatellia bacterium]
MFKRQGDPARNFEVDGKDIAATATARAAARFRQQCLDRIGSLAGAVPADDHRLSDPARRDFGPINEYRWFAMADAFRKEAISISEGKPRIGE